jgi:hypothetical protein
MAQNERMAPPIQKAACRVGEIAALQYLQVTDPVAGLQQGGSRGEGSRP